jgi:hypothetical protein
MCLPVRSVGLVAAGIALTLGLLAVPALPRGAASSDQEVPAPASAPPGATEIPDTRTFLRREQVRSLHPKRSWRADLDGDGAPEELLLLPARDPGEGGTARYRLAVLKRGAGGYRFDQLLDFPAEEFDRLRILPLAGSGPPQMVVSTRGGSGGFLALHVFQWRGGRPAETWTLEGIYQGRYWLSRRGPGQPYHLCLTRAVAGDVNAFPRAEWREEYGWSGDRFRLLSRWRRPLPRVLLPRRRPHPLPKARPGRRIDLNGLPPPVLEGRQPIARWRKPLECRISNQPGPGRATVTPLTPGAPPQPPATGQKIAFVRDGNLWVMRTDGKEQRQLTTDGRDQFNEAVGIWYTRPIWLSPSVLLAFGRTDEERWAEPAKTGLYRIDLTMGDVHRVRTVKVDDYGWGAQLVTTVPKTWQVAFSIDIPEGLTDAYLLDLKTGKVSGLDGLLPRRIWRQIGLPEYPCWNSDGQRVVFLAGRGDPETPAALYVADAKGRRVRRLCAYDWSSPGIVSFFWTPDGSIWTRDEAGQGVLNIDPARRKILRRTRFPRDFDAAILPTEVAGDLFLLNGGDLYRWHVSKTSQPVKLAEAIEAASVSPGAATP